MEGVTSFFYFFYFFKDSFPIQVSFSIIGGELLLLHSEETLENLKTYKDPHEKKKKKAQGSSFKEQLWRMSTHTTARRSCSFQGSG